MESCSLNSSTRDQKQKLRISISQLPFWGNCEKSIEKLDPLKDFPNGLSAEAEECWFALASGALDCDREELRQLKTSITSQSAKKLDLQQAARDWADRFGMRRARDLMIHALQMLDSDQNQIEKRAIRVGQKDQYVYEDSLMALPPKD